MTRNINTARLRAQLQEKLSAALYEGRFPVYLLVKVDVVDELLDIADAYDELVAELIESYRPERLAAQ